MIFKGGTIRVISPIREGGNRVRVDAETGQTMYKEEFFPATAKPHFDKLNRSLPNHLKKKIEFVSDGDVPAPQVKHQAVDAAPIVKKRGPKPKVNAQTN